MFVARVATLDPESVDSVLESAACEFVFTVTRENALNRISSGSRDMYEEPIVRYRNHASRIPQMLHVMGRWSASCLALATKLARNQALMTVGASDRPPANGGTSGLPIIKAHSSNYLSSPSAASARGDRAGAGINAPPCRARRVHARRPVAASRKYCSAATRVAMVNDKPDGFSFLIAALVRSEQQRIARTPQKFSRPSDDAARFFFFNQPITNRGTAILPPAPSPMPPTSTPSCTATALRSCARCNRPASTL
jgi:hypothetical protein